MKMDRLEFLKRMKADFPNRTDEAYRQLVESKVEAEIAHLEHEVTRALSEEEEDTVNVKVPVGQDLVVKNKERKRSELFPFTPIDSLNMKDSTNLAEDILEKLIKLSKPASRLFIEIKRNTNRRDNLCHHPTNDMTRSQKVMFNRALKQLIDADLIKRAKTIDLKKPISPDTLMINPHLIKPSKNTADIQKNWELM